MEDEDIDLITPEDDEETDDGDFVETVFPDDDEI